MNMLWTLARKEVLLAFRDRGALISMLVTPLLLTVAIAAAFGGGGDRPISDIPVLLINRDEGALGAAVVEAFQSDQVQGLVIAELVTDEAHARLRVDRDEAAALVIVPTDFSARMLPLPALLEEGGAASPEQIEALGRALAGEEDATEPILIELYASPTRRIGAAVTQAIVAQVLDGMHMTIRGVQVSLGQLVIRDRTLMQDPTRLYTLGQSLARSLVEGAAPSAALIALEIADGGYRPFRWVDYTAASMAVLFMMFTAMAGGRSLLHEREAGTLPRLLITPNRAPVILAGKMAGVAATGILQMVILWQATGLVGAYWGPPLLVIGAIVVVVLCATGLGALIAAWVRTPSQAGALGSGVALAGAALSGSFIPRMTLPAWVRVLSLVTPNAWGIEIFTRAQSGQEVALAAPYLAGALIMAIVYFVVASVGFRRQFSG